MRAGAGIDRPAVEQMLRGEPVGAEVVARRKDEGDQDRDDCCEERRRDAGKPEDPLPAGPPRDRRDQATRSPA